MAPTGEGEVEAAGGEGAEADAVAMAEMAAVGLHHSLGRMKTHSFARG